MARAGGGGESEWERVGAGIFIAAGLAQLTIGEGFQQPAARTAACNGRPARDAGRATRRAPAWTRTRQSTC